MPPQVTSAARKPLSIAFEEIAADKIEGVSGVSELDLVEPSTSPRSSTATTPTAPEPISSMASLAGRRIVLGVSGGIAAYKAIEVCRRLVDAGAHVVPVLTDGATRFVGETTLLGARVRAGADVAVRRRATRSRTPASARPPT